MHSQVIFSIAFLIVSSTNGLDFWLQGKGIVRRDDFQQSSVVRDISPENTPVIEARAPKSQRRGAKKSGQRVAGGRTVAINRRDLIPEATHAVEARDYLHQTSTVQDLSPEITQFVGV